VNDFVKKQLFTTRFELRTSTVFRQPPLVIAVFEVRILALLGFVVSDFQQ
jgi:hypothetical protein